MYVRAEIKAGEEKSDYERLQREEKERGFWGSGMKVKGGNMAPRKVVLNPAAFPAPTDVERYNWIDREVVGTKSVLKTEVSVNSVRQLLLPCPEDETRTSYAVRSCTENDRICTRVLDGKSFFMYEDLVSLLGARLPFSEVETRLLQVLGIAPSQLHPQAWAFLRAFQKYCQTKNLLCLVQTFLCLFHPQTTIKESGELERLWVSVKSRSHYGLFAKYLDSWKYFKKKFFRYEYILDQLATNPDQIELESRRVRPRIRLISTASDSSRSEDTSSTQEEMAGGDQADILMEALRGKRRRVEAGGPSAGDPLVLPTPAAGASPDPSRNSPAEVVMVAPLSEEVSPQTIVVATQGVPDTVEKTSDRAADLTRLSSSSVNFSDMSAEEWKRMTGEMAEFMRFLSSHVADAEPLCNVLDTMFRV
ncbi:hypothetical protein RIF29_38405 [Crotalaria pallida]|uniref:Uncharacterized protein n=1 Tax=Crotalaria pallida TaxID=3830 RepID=A0AAN9HLH8_CROPI